MNDPGLDEPIKDDAKRVEEGTSYEDKDEADDDEAYLKPSRWWFASTAFPLIAGTFGPMANAFNVCAIASHWRYSVQPGQNEDDGYDVADPEWLIAINAVSLVVALIANLSLLFNMARRIPFSIAQPITIVGWYVSGFILVGLVAAADAPSFQMPPSANVFLTQAYYYAALAAALYIIVASMMVVTVFGAYKGHYNKDFNLTMSQRTLMLQTIAYLVYMIAGGAVFARIEGWSFLDGVWWSNFTLLTIGIGDFYPITHLGQSLLFPFAIGGIVILGLVIGSIRSLVLERGEKKIAARMVEKKREQVVDQLDGNRGEKKIKISPLARNIRFKTEGKSEYRRRGEEFRLMRKIQEYAETRRKWTSLIISALSWLALWLVGAAVFWVAERNLQPVTYFDEIYFAYTSLLTIGYGDYTMMSNAGKPVFVFWSLLAVPTLTILISNMGDTVVKGIRDATLWLGELTVLPGEGSTLHRVKESAHVIKSKTLRGEISDPVEEPPGGAFMPEGSRRTGQGNTKATHSARDAAINRLGEDLEEEELDEAKVAQERGDKLSEDVHLYHYLLVKEIRNVMKDVNETPPRKYSYHEWAWFLRLLGEDENDPKYHRQPAQGADADTSDMQQADKTSGGKSSSWSWVGINSPLLGETEEAEWILERLSEKLESELRRQKSRRKAGDAQEPPPVTKGSRDEQEEPPLDDLHSKDA